MHVSTRHCSCIAPPSVNSNYPKWPTSPTSLGLQRGPGVGAVGPVPSPGGHEVEGQDGGHHHLRVEAVDVVEVVVERDKPDQDGEGHRETAWVEGGEVKSWFNPLPF